MRVSLQAVCNHLGCYYLDNLLVMNVLNILMKNNFSDEFHPEEDLFSSMSPYMDLKYTTSYQQMCMFNNMNIEYGKIS